MWQTANVELIVGFQHKECAVMKGLNGCVGLFKFSEFGKAGNVVRISRHQLGPGFRECMDFRGK